MHDFSGRADILPTGEKVAGAAELEPFAQDTVGAPGCIVTGVKPGDYTFSSIHNLDDLDHCDAL